LISLIGFKSSGKTSLGKILANKLSCSWIDTDHLIEKQFQKSIAEIYQEHLESAFRLLEYGVISQLPKGLQVVSTGGGVVTFPKSMVFLQKHSKIIYLKVSFDILASRIQKNPAFAVDKDLSDIYQIREKLYEYYADQVVDISNDSIDEAVEKVLRVCHGK
jgi:shikimate kinase